MNSKVIFDKTQKEKFKDWFVKDDVVMGGRSQGELNESPDGFLEFKGKVSLENNGGFSSIRLPVEITYAKEYNKIELKVKGDGKAYQFRLKKNRDEKTVYVGHFQTSGKFEIISFELKSLEPVFRGEKLDLPGFNGNQIEEIGILISNRKAEEYRLLVEHIILSI